jgi:hypothetical protein
LNDSLRYKDGLKNCMKLFILFALIFFLLFSCKTKNQQPETRMQVPDSTLVRWGLPFHNLSVDSNELIFYSLNNFDTSFLIHFYYQTSKVVGVYYEILPENHLDVEDFKSPENELIFYDGFTFKLKTEKWSYIKSEIEKQLLFKEPRSIGGACNDCTHYIVAHNSKIINSSKINSVQFASFEKYLRDSFITSFIKYKTPFKR